MALHRDALGRRPEVSQLHLGGGTPTFLSDAELTQLMDMLRAHFRLAPSAEISIEVDPRTVTAERLRHFFSIGFNRLSFGVQDFDPAVQRAVHRVQSHDMVADLMQAARTEGFESINVDLIYGLPLQTAASFARTVEQVSALRPDRIALYAYAHLPQRFMPQRRIASADLPVPAVRVAMLGGAIQGFLGAGYDYIGMDHFALESDSLAQAKRHGRLHRNFQGYSTQPDCDLIALGVSAIGRIGSHYSQNAKTLPEYVAAIQAGRFATVRGYSSTRDDLVRRTVIMALMCQGRVDFESIEVTHLIDFPSYFATELEHLRAMAETGMVNVDPHSIEVTPLGWYLVRAIAMVFDAHLQSAQDAGRFSRIG